MAPFFTVDDDMHAYTCCHIRENASWFSATFMSTLHARSDILCTYGYGVFKWFWFASWAQTGLAFHHEKLASMKKEK